MGMGRALALTRAHFLFTKSALYRACRATGYGDKVQRAIGATDPGAVPGVSTIKPCYQGFSDGGEPGSTWAEKRCFCPG